MSTEKQTDEFARGAAVGRFVLLGLLGRGGVGEVHAAYDPELDRRVAVKILHSRSPKGDARLLREAKTLAKLQHPNVVVVYEVGKFRDIVFIAMEFVEGSTLGAWMKDEPRPWRETLRLFQAAGRGLSAAHEIGIIHRDFKPDNVMLTKNGEVRVMDFGLARQVDETTQDAAEDPPDVVGAPGTGLAIQADPEFAADGNHPVPDDVRAARDTAKLTRTGALLGTPAYMAPEQFAGGAIDARTDQFSFCVALYEALYGERPFEGDTVLSLGVNVAEGRMRPPPERSRVPGWVRRVVLRGLSAVPEARFPSMKALLAALDADPVARRRLWGMTIVGAVLFGGLGILASRAGRGSRPACGSGADRFAGVWDAGMPSARKQVVRAAFLATGTSFAAQSYAATARLLDDYVGRWTVMYRETCEATRVRGDQSEEVLDLRMSCLGERLLHVRALTDIFVSADRDVVATSASAAGALPSLDRCADMNVLRAVIKPPEDAVTRRRVGELREELARVIALRDSGQCKLAEIRGVALIDAVRSTKYHPLLGEALTAVGLLGDRCAATDASLARLKEGYYEAAVGRDDATAVDAATDAALLFANRLGQPANARDWLMVARASAARMSNAAAVEGFLLTAEGAILGAEHDVDRFVETNRQAAAVTAKTLGPDHPLALGGLANLGEALSAAGRYDEAVVADESALAAARRVLGPEHPEVALILSNECEALNRSHRFNEAHRACARAMDIWRLVRPDALILSFTGTQLGVALIGLGRPAEAIAPLEESLASRVAARSAVELQGESRFALARAVWSRAAGHPRALALARQAREDYTANAKAVAEIDAWLAAPHR